MSDTGTIDKLRSMAAVACPDDGIGFMIGNDSSLVTWAEIAALLDDFERLETERDTLRQTLTEWQNLVVTVQDIIGGKGPIEDASQDIVTERDELRAALEGIALQPGDGVFARLLRAQAREALRKNDER